MPPATTGPSCRCGKPSRLYQMGAQSERPNAAYYACALPRTSGDRCRFFEWFNSYHSAATSGGSVGAASRHSTTARAPAPRATGTPLYPTPPGPLQQRQRQPPPPQRTGLSATPSSVPPGRVPLPVPMQGLTRRAPATGQTSALERAQTAVMASPAGVDTVPDYIVCANGAARSIVCLDDDEEDEVDSMALSAYGIPASRACAPTRTSRPLASVARDDAATMPMWPVTEPLSGVRCKHEAKAHTGLTRKEGKNLGRRFYTCCHPFRSPERCDFFKWHDELLEQMGDPLMPLRREIVLHNAIYAGREGNAGRFDLADPRISYLTPWGAFEGARAALTASASCETKIGTATTAVMPTGESPEADAFLTDPVTMAAAAATVTGFSPRDQTDAMPLVNAAVDTLAAPLPKTRRQLFVELVACMAEARGFVAELASDYFAVYHHGDVRISSDPYGANRMWIHAVAAPALSPDHRPVFDPLYVQLHGDAPDDGGWLASGDADVVAFETHDGVLLVDRARLWAFIEKHHCPSSRDDVQARSIEDAVGRRLCMALANGSPHAVSTLVHVATIKAASTSTSAAAVSGQLVIDVWPYATTAPENAAPDSPASKAARATCAYLMLVDHDPTTIAQPDARFALPTTMTTATESTDATNDDTSAAPMDDSR